jgi:hypothetical protein
MAAHLFKRFAPAAYPIIVICAVAWFGRGWWKDEQLLALLRAHKLTEARAALNDFDDWPWLLGRIARSNDRALVQAAFDVQFEYWYSRDEDGNYPYPEHISVLERLLKLGAVPHFDDLLEATQDGKSATAWLLLRSGVPAFLPGTSNTPLANTAYCGDIDLMAELLRRGADINQPGADGWRPVLAAAWDCQADAVRYLLDHGADVSLSYQEYEGHSEPIWEVIEERARKGGNFAEVWDLVRERIPSKK